MKNLVFATLILTLATYFEYSVTVPTPWTKICVDQRDISFFNKSKSFFNAKKSCINYGGHLVKVNSERIQNAIENTVPPKPEHYIGAMDEGTNKNWKWQDGSTLPLPKDKKGYQNWRSGQPNSVNEKCVTIGTHHSYNWSDIDCQEKHNYICQKESRPEITNIQNATCNGGIWITWKPSICAIGFYHRISAISRNLSVNTSEPARNFGFHETEITGLDLSTDYRVTVAVCLNSTACDTEFVDEKRIRTTKIATFFTLSAKLKLDDDGKSCVGSWNSTRSSFVTFSIKIECSSEMLGGDAMTSTSLTNTTNAYIRFIPYPNQKCNLSVRAIGCSEPVNAAGSCIMLTASDNTWAIGLGIGVVGCVIGSVAAYFLLRVKRKRVLQDNTSQDTESCEQSCKPIEISGEKSDESNIKLPSEGVNTEPNDKCKKVDSCVNFTVEPSSTSEGTAIKQCDLETSFNAMQQKNGAGFRKQYDKILQKSTKNEKTTKVASSQACLKMNRYKNVLPFDDSRVPLFGSELNYINASYIDGYKQEMKYIATQGPLESTIPDFWLMVLEQNCQMIIMLTTEYDSGKKKCIKYWPDLGKSIKFSNGVMIECEEAISYNSYIERTFHLKNKREGISLTTYQYQYVTWPDHGVPRTTSSLMRMHHYVNEMLEKLGGEFPVVVHCSAGAGRTGVYIGYDILLKELTSSGVVDVFNCVSSMRQQRVQMVQNCNQYAFLYKLLLEATLFDFHDMSTEEIKEASKMILSYPEQCSLEKEFDNLSRVAPMKNSTFIGMHSESEDSAINHELDAASSDSSMVVVERRGEETEPPYINASWIEAYDRATHMIAAQGPMDDTIEIFWRAVFDNHVTAIVMLTQLKEGEKQLCAQYWPQNVGDTSSWREISVTYSSDSTADGALVERKLKIVRGLEHKTVTQFHFTGWSSHSCPENEREVVELINKVQKWHRSAGEGALLIHCCDGIGRTGAFCAIMNLIDRMKCENRIDVFRTVKDLRDRRPNMVRNLDQYRFCYQAVLDYLKLFELYSNF